MYSIFSICQYLSTVWSSSYITLLPMCTRVLQSYPVIRGNWFLYIRVINFVIIFSLLSSLNMYMMCTLWYISLFSLFICFSRSDLGPHELRHGANHPHCGHPHLLRLGCYSDHVLHLPHEATHHQGSNEPVTHDRGTAPRADLWPRPA